MKSQVLLINLVIALIFFQGCKSVKSILNEQKVSSQDEQNLAINANSKTLSLINSCDVTINIGKNDFNNLLIPVLSKKINELEIAHVKSYQVSKLVTTTDKEQINFTSDFSLTADTLNASIRGNLIGTVAFGVRNDSLIFFPAFKYIHVSDLTYKKVNRIERKAVALLLNLILKGFIKQVNGYMISKLPAMPLKVFDKEVTAQEFLKDPSVNVTLSTPLKIITPYYVPSCMIDENGIHILAIFSKAPYLTASTADSGPQIEFKDFQKSFIDKMNTCFANAPKDDTTYTLLAKSAFASFFNTAVSNENISISYSNPKVFSGQFDKNIKINLDEIDCSKVSVPCPQVHIVPDCKMPDFGNCDGGCGRFDFFCKGKEAACKVKVLAEKTAWLTNVYPGCKILQANETAFNLNLKANCLATQAAAVAGCAITKKALEVVLTDQISIGDIHATVAASANAAATITGMNLNSDLSGFNFSTQVSVNSGLNTTFGFTPEGPAGHLVCVLKFDHPYNCGASTAIPSTPFTVTSTFEQAAKDRLTIKFAVDSQSVHINIDPTPLTLMNRDITTLLNCPLLQFGVGLTDIVKGFKDLFFKGDFLTNTEKAIVEGQYDYKLKSYDFTLPINAIQLKLNENTITLNPLNQATYFGFYKN